MCVSFVWHIFFEFNLPNIHSILNQSLIWISSIPPYFSVEWFKHNFSPAVKDGQVIALLDGKLVASADTVEHGLFELLDKAGASKHEIVTLFFGEDMTHAEANRFADAVRGKYSNLEVEVQEGGQPHYQFILSIE